MTADAATDSPVVAPGNNRYPFWRWLVSAALGVGLLYLAAVHAPQRVKLPLITPLALGIAAGWGLGRWACACRVTNPRLVAIASFLLIAGGAIGMAGQSYRLGRAEIERAARHQSAQDPQDDGLAERMRDAMLESAPDQSTRDELAQAQRRQQAELDRQRRFLTFAGYLEHRIPQAWGRWPAPWPELFWGAEVLLSAGLGAWMAARFSRIETAAPRTD